MGSPQSLFIFLILTLFVILCSSAGYTNLIFKGCADQNFQNFNSFYSQTLNNLLDTLTSQSSARKFYNATSGDASSAINGVFQCRGDLSNDECNSCVKKIPSLAQRICGEAIAARVQLNGCYLMYEVSGFREVSGTELLYKVCGLTQANGTGFGGRLDTAFGEIAKGVGSGNGFYTGGFQSVYVLGQCEGDLGGGDCVNCVKSAIDSAKANCENAISAQIYLKRCYISYAYYPNGVPRNDQPLSSSPETGRSTQKTVAIVLGGVGGVVLFMACLLFAKSAFKKKTHFHKYSG